MKKKKEHLRMEFYCIFSAWFRNWERNHTNLGFSKFNWKMIDKLCRFLSSYEWTVGQLQSNGTRGDHRSESILCKNRRRTNHVGFSFENPMFFG